MAQGDLTVFDVAKEYLADGTHDLDTTTTATGYYCAIITDTTTPVTATTSPQLGDFTEVTTAGTYTANGTWLGVCTWGDTAGTSTFDSGVNPTWAQDAANSTDARWAIIYRLGTHNSIPDPAVAFVDLGGTVDMTAGDLTITWSGSGIFTLT